MARKQMQSKMEPKGHSTAPLQTETTTSNDADSIARLAYSYWEARGRDGGSPEEDWIRTENELKASAKRAQPAK